MAYFVGKTVAFCAEDEPWMTDEHYGHVASFYLIGRVNAVLEEQFIIEWLDSNISHKPIVPWYVVARGRDQYAMIKDSKEIPDM